MKNKYLIIILVVTSILIMSTMSFADKRSYVWTYEYKTVEKGKAELEYYLTLSSSDIGELEGNTSSEHQVELEVGMTDRFDFAVYQIFSQGPNEDLKYKGFKLRARYRIGEKGKYILDPLIYLEYKGEPDFSEHEIEFKPIFAKDIGKFNFALNPIFEFEKDGEWKFKPKYAIGASYEILDLTRIGIEVNGSENGHYWGPVISHGKNDLWVALGSAFKIGEIKNGKPEFQLRMILGLGF